MRISQQREPPACLHSVPTKEGTGKPPPHCPPRLQPRLLAAPHLPHGDLAPRGAAAGAHRSSGVPLAALSAAIGHGRHRLDGPSPSVHGLDRSQHGPQGDGLELLLWARGVAAGSRVQPQLRMCEGSPHQVSIGLPAGAMPLTFCWEYWGGGAVGGLVPGTCCVVPVTLPQL